MKRLVWLLPLLAVLSCRQDSIGPLNGIMVVHSSPLAGYIDEGGLDELHLVVETVDPEQVFSFSYADLSEFKGTLKERRIILLLLAPEDAGEIPGGMEQIRDGVYSGEDVWALNQRVFAVVTDGTGDLPAGLADDLLQAYSDQMHAYLYRSFVSTSMTSQARMDSLQAAFGFSMDVPKSYITHKWMQVDRFVQYQRQPDDECLLLLSMNIIATDAELTADNAMLAREAMARTYFYDADADSVDRARTRFEPWTQGGMQGVQLTGVWRNPEYLNAGAFTCRVLDAGDEWYILDMEVYNPGYGKEPYLREGWIIMNTFHKE